MVVATRLEFASRKPPMISVIIAIHLMLVLALIGVVLLQKSEGGGLVSSSSGFLSSRGTANVLTRATALLATGFFITSLALSLLASHGRESLPILNGTTTPAQHAPAAGGTIPLTPLNQGNGGLLKQLGGNSAPAKTENAPAVPGPASSTETPAPAPARAPAPSGPQVPQSH
jgi:preprotein translocase subunit SecG